MAIRIFVVNDPNMIIKKLQKIIPYNQSIDFYKKNKKKKISDIEISPRDYKQNPGKTPLF